MLIVAVIVAAGSGVRMGGDVPKALMPLAGRPMLLWSLDALRASALVDHVVVVGPPGRLGEIRDLAGGAVDVTVTAGGASRQESVREGLRAAPAEATAFLVHDAARPLIDEALIAAVLGGLDGVAGAIAAAPVVDTLKRADAGGCIGGTVAREGLWAAATPQAFHAGALREATEAAAAAGTLATATDCASVIEEHGGRVRLVAAPGPNPKVTTPVDVAVAEALLAARARG
jgi:2-C-methyl-D-erythritol 4-phosphate cytidylyltransferase